MLPQIKKILYATDLSQNARQALGYAATLADRHGAELTVLHVLPDSLELLSEQAGLDLAETFGEQAARFIDKGDIHRSAESIHERLETMARERFAAPDGPTHLTEAAVKVLCGDAADRILAEAESGGHDLIVMGTHGQGGILGMLLGSVASETVRRSSVPVMVVPLPENRA